MLWVIAKYSVARKLQTVKLSYMWNMLLINDTKFINFVHLSLNNNAVSNSQVGGV